MGLYLSVTSRSSIETTKRIDIVFGIDAFFLLLLRSAVSAKVAILPFRTASQTLDLENFATARRSCLGQQNSSTVELADDTCGGRRVVNGRK